MPNLKDNSRGTWTGHGYVAGCLVAIRRHISEENRMLRGIAVEADGLEDLLWKNVGPDGPNADWPYSISATSDGDAQRLVRRLGALRMALGPYPRDEEAELAEMRRRLTIIAADVSALRDEWLEAQPEGLRKVIANIRKNVDFDFIGAAAGTTAPEPNDAAHRPNGTGSPDDPLAPSYQSPAAGGGE